MNCLKYSDDLAMRTTIQIVDADHQQEFPVFRAFRLKHPQEHLDSPQKGISLEMWDLDVVTISFYRETSKAIFLMCSTNHDFKQ